MSTPVVKMVAMLDTTMDLFRAQGGQYAQAWATRVVKKCMLDIGQPGNYSMRFMRKGMMVMIVMDVPSIAVDILLREVARRMVCTVAYGWDLAHIQQVVLCGLGGWSM